MNLLDGKHLHHKLLADCAKQQREADAALVEAAESEIHVLLTDETASRSQMAYNVISHLAAKLRGQS